MSTLPNRNQGPIEDGFFWQDELIFGQCDRNLNVKISTLLEQLVTIASQHCRSFGMNYESFLESDTAFVLTRTTLTVHELPKCFQLITLKTWIDGIKGPYYQRVTQWFDEENKLMVSGRADWVLIAPSSRQFLKPDKSDSRFITKSPVEILPCERIKFQDVSFEKIGEHQVVWTEIDGNGHLHSAFYSDIVYNHLPEGLRKASAKSFSIEFQKESYLDDVITLSLGEVGGNHYIITGESKGVPNFKCSIHI